MILDIDREEVDAQVASNRAGLMSNVIERKVLELHDHHPEELAEFRHRILLHRPLTVDEILGYTALADLISLQDRLSAYIRGEMEVIDQL